MSLPMSGKLIRVGIIQQRSCCFRIGAGDPNAAYQWMKQKVSLQWILILPYKLKIGKMVVYFYYIKEWKITFLLLTHLLCHTFNVYSFPRKSTRRKFFVYARCTFHVVWLWNQLVKLRSVKTFFSDKIITSKIVIVIHKEHIKKEISMVGKDEGREEMYE